MIGLAVVEILLALIILGLLFFVISHEPTGDKTRAIQEARNTVLYFGLFAGLALALSALHAIAGIRNLQFQGYLLGLISLAATVFGMSLNLILCVTVCFYLPLCLAMMIYGLIVYIQKDVVDAFQMGEEGKSVDEILRTYS